jgi:polysaccharide export outer membrane protein
MSVAAILALMMMAGAQAQQPPQERVAPPRSRTEPVSAMSEVASPDYQLGPGDEISIHVSGLKEFTQQATVSNSGRVRVSFVGVLFVAGMTPVQLENEIVKQVKEHELVLEPVVRVQIEKFRARNAYVTGEVVNAGQYIVTHETRLLDLVSKAGGLLATADDVGYLYRRRRYEPSIETRVFAGDEQPAAAAGTVPSAPRANDTKSGEPAGTIKISLRDLEDGSKPEVNIKLESGDVLYVPRRKASNFYVIGDVKVPGPFTIPRGVTVTAAQAVTYAGGTLATAKQGKGFLMRHGPNGHESMAVNFKAIIEGKEPDIPIQADDIIFIPNSAVRTIGVGLLIMVPTIIQQWLIF